MSIKSRTYQDHEHAVYTVLGCLLAMEIYLVVKNPGSMLWWGLFGTNILALVGLKIFQTYLRRLYTTALPPSSLWLIVIAVIWDALGNSRGWYDTIPWFDNSVHFLSGITLAHIFFHMRQNPYVAFATATLFAVFFEITEYSLDLIQGKSYWLGSGPDTVLDLIAGMAGAIATLLLLRKISFIHF